MLTTIDHPRNSAGLLYVYPVVSRRAGGVSIGINLNVNHACNWACVYCQVPGLRRGGPPPVDLDRLRQELESFLDSANPGCLQSSTPEASVREPPGRQAQGPERVEGRIVDIAFSGNGEPTSAPEFPEAVSIVQHVLAARGWAASVKIRLITNGSLVHRPAVQTGLARIGAAGGEIWFKIDRLGTAARTVNGVFLSPARALNKLRLAASLAPTWVQTCWFALDGQAPSPDERAAYCALIAQAADRIAGIHLYGLARPSRQPAAPRLAALPAEELARFADQIEKTTGIRATISV